MIFLNHDFLGFFLRTSLSGVGGMVTSAMLGGLYGTNSLLVLVAGPCGDQIYTLSSSSWPQAVS